MKKIERLRKEALESCEFRDHRMGLFNRTHPHYWHSKCRACGMEVHITDNPAPNEINIGGQAVALNCLNKSGG